MSKIRKAVFPVGGLGTRFLPATKAMPKEMLPIVDKPLIQYAVDEAHEAGIEEFIFVTGRGKSAIEDYFDISYELNDTVAGKGDDGLRQQLEDICLDPGQISYTRQQKPLGLGHAVWCARHLVGNEAFAVLLADDLILGEPSCLAQLIAAHESTGGAVLAALEIDPRDSGKYGILAPGASDGDLIEVTDLVEKPAPDKAPSALSVTGRYILTPEIFDLLADHETGAGGEIQLTEAIARLIGTVPVHGWRFSGVRHDCGSKAGFIEATLAVAAAHPELRDILPALLDKIRK